MGNYKQKLKSFMGEREFHFDKMLAFGEAMCRAMDLSQEELKNAGDMVWHIAGFQLSVRSFPQNNWQEIITATPTGIDSNRVGYSNTPEVVPESWYLSADGTATIFYPPDSIQKEILERIRKGTI